MIFTAEEAERKGGWGRVWISQAKCPPGHETAVCKRHPEPCQAECSQNISNLLRGSSDLHPCRKVTPTVPCPHPGHEDGASVSPREMLSSRKFYSLHTHKKGIFVKIPNFKQHRSKSRW